MNHPKMPLPPFGGEPFDSTFDTSISVHHLDINAPQLRIIEQPKQYGFRFRYECEGKSHGGIPGISSERGKKTYPSTEIINYKGLARIVVSLVTNEEMPRPHAHSLVGKHCTNGICSVQVGSTDMTASFPNLGILHITKKNVIPILKKRMFDYQETSKNLWGQSNDQLTDSVAEQRAKDLAKDMDLASVRLCFQAFLPDANGHFTQPLPPVISVPIYDSKAPNATTLKICRMDRTSGRADGGDEVYMLCDKVQKDDIQVRFFETPTDEGGGWEDFADFGPTDVHRQYAIVFRTPRYKNGDIRKPVHVHLQLMRKSTREKSEPKPFCYYPNPFDRDQITKKRQKTLPLFTHHIMPGGYGERFPGSSGSGGSGSAGDGLGGGGGGGTGGGGLNFQLHTGSVQHLPFDQTPVAMTPTTNSSSQPPMPTVNGVDIQDRRSSPFSQSTEGIFQHNLQVPTLPTTTQMQQQQNHQIQAYSLPPIVHQQQRQPAPRQQQQRQQPQIAMQFPDFIAASPQDVDPANLVPRGPKVAKTADTAKLISRGLKPANNAGTANLVPRGPKPANNAGSENLISRGPKPEKDTSTASLIPRGLKLAKDSETKLISRGLNKPSNMDTSDSGDSDLETDSAPSTEIKTAVPDSKTVISATEILMKNTLHHSAVQTDSEPNKLMLLAENTFSALYDYAITGDVRMMLAVQRHLLAVQDDYGDTCLHMSIIHQEYEVTKSIVAIIVKMPHLDIINMPNDLRQTPLHLAVITNRPNTVELLMSNGADPNLMDQHGNTPLHLAVQYGNIDSVYSLIHNYSPTTEGPRIPMDVDMQNHNGYAPIHLACRNGDLKSVKALCHAHCNVDIQDGTSGYTPLHFAVENQDFGILGYLLLDTNANVHEVTFTGNTPLHLAAGRNLVAVAALLLASHADPLKENYDTYIDTSDSSDDENEDPNMDITDDELCGKTSLDLASTDEMRRLLNGEPYIKGPSTNFTRSEFRLLSEVTDKCDSFKIDSSMTSLCDPITLDRLARLLDQHETWAEVAKKIGLGNIISWLRQASSPTRDLLYHFEKIDGTLEELKEILSTMGRTDAVEIINERSLNYIASPFKTPLKDYRVDSVKDSGISDDLIESLRKISVKGN